MAKKTTAARKQAATRNWIAYLCESLVTSGVMPTWEAATYLTENLFGEKPNPRLLSTTNAYEVTSQFLQRLYHPLVEAASRDITLPDGAMVHVFTDISHLPQQRATRKPDSESSPFSPVSRVSSGYPPVGS